MIVPMEFRNMMGRLDSNFEHLSDHTESLVAHALRWSTADLRMAIKNFLDELLSESRSYDELQQVWFSGAVEFGILDEDKLRFFFIVMQQRLAAES